MRNKNITYLVRMRAISIEIIFFILATVTIISHTETTTKRAVSTSNTGFRRCQKPKNGQQLCICGKNKMSFDRLKGERCINGQVVRKESQGMYVNLNNWDVLK